MRFFMSIETATQRLNTALGDLEAKLNRRLDALEGDNARLRHKHDALLAENQALIAAVQDTDSGGLVGLDATAYVALEKQSSVYRATLAQALRDIDSLISRVSSAAQ
jgi:phage shock protein A